MKNLSYVKKSDMSSWLNPTIAKTMSKYGSVLIVL